MKIKTEIEREAQAVRLRTIRDMSRALGIPRRLLVRDLRNMSYLRCAPITECQRPEDYPPGAVLCMCGKCEARNSVAL